MQPRIEQLKPAHARDHCEHSGCGCDRSQLPYLLYCNSVREPGTIHVQLQPVSAVADEQVDLSIAGEHKQQPTGTGNQSLLLGEHTHTIHIVYGQHL